MNSRPFILIGETTKSRLHEVAQAAASAWKNHWFPGFKGDIGVVVESGVIGAGSMQWHESHSTAVPGYIGIGDGAAAAFFGILNSEVLTSPGEALENLFLQLMNDYLKRVSGASTGVSMGTPKVTKLPEELNQRGSGAATVKFAIAGWSASFLLPRQTVKLHLAKKAAPRRSQLVRLRDSIGTATLDLGVGMNASHEISASAIHDLAVGDVILFGKKINQPLDLISSRGVKVGDLELGRLQRNKAVALVSKSST